MSSERRNITQPADWWAAFEKQANAEGMTLSQWVGWACKAKLPRGIGIHAGLSKRPAAHRPRSVASEMTQMKWKKRIQLTRLEKLSE